PTPPHVPRPEEPRSSRARRLRLSARRSASSLNSTLRQQVSRSLPKAAAEAATRPCRRSGVAARSRAGPSREFTRDSSRRASSWRTFLLDPSPREPRPAQPAHNVRVAAHEPPDELRAVVLGHREDGPLVDAQVIDVEPAAGARLRERGIEGVAEAVGREQVAAVSLAHRVEGGNRDLWRERDRPSRGGGADGAVVRVLDERRATRPVAVELAAATV